MAKVSQNKLLFGLKLKIEFVEGYFLMYRMKEAFGFTKQYE